MKKKIISLLLVLGILIGMWDMTTWAQETQEEITDEIVKKDIVPLAIDETISLEVLGIPTTEVDTDKQYPITVRVANNGIVSFDLEECYLSFEESYSDKEGLTGILEPDESLDIEIMYEVPRGTWGETINDMVRLRRIGEGTIAESDYFLIKVSEVGKPMELGVTITPKFDVNRIEYGVKQSFTLSITNPSDRVLENFCVSIYLISSYEPENGPAASSVPIAQGRFEGVTYPYPDGEEETDIWTIIGRLEPYETGIYSCTIMVSESWMGDGETESDSGHSYSLDVDVYNSEEDEFKFGGYVSLPVKMVKKHTHSYKNVISKASLASDGSITKKCSVCGDVSDKTTIYYPKNIALSASEFAYNGKAQNPAVTVTGSDGKTIAPSNYTVSYSPGCKNVGHYKATIAFKGNYSGTVTKTFNINPKGTKLSSVKPGKKKAAIKWKKQTKYTKGYQIQYSTKKNFKSGVKTKTIKGSKKTSLTIKGLKSKKTYYIRVRTYQNASGGKCYSSWSKAKKVKVK